MKVIRSRFTGYCHGVSATVKAAHICIEKAKELGKNSYSIGQLIHNRDTVEYFEKKGLKVIQKPSDADPGVALIRAHGLPSDLVSDFEKGGYILIDATCRNISETEKAMHDAVNNGRSIILLGEKGHAETLCLTGQGFAVNIVSTVSEAEKLCECLDGANPVAVFVQTTFSEEKYTRITEILSAQFPDMKIGNSLCSVCSGRKKDALELSDRCGAMIVVGGKDSQNTKELASFIERTGKPVFLFENAKDISEDAKARLSAYETVGICSGTSTPQNVIDEVCSTVSAIENNIKN